MTKVIETEVLDYIPNDDGYTEERYINAVPRLYNATTISFRPFDVMKRAMLLEVRKRTNEEKFTKVLVQELTKHVVSWSIKMRLNHRDPSSELIPMPIDEKHVAKIRIPLLLRMIDIVIWGIDGGDQFPATEAEATNEDDFEKRMKALLEDPQPVSEQIEADQKN